MSDVVSEAWKKYLLQLQLHPLRTKAITAGVIAGISDFAAQKISRIKKLQYRRLFLIMLYGPLYSGPFGHFFHKLTDKFFKGKKANNTVGKKLGFWLITVTSPNFALLLIHCFCEVLVEQLTAGPCNNMIFMIYCGLVVDGRKWSFAKNKFQKDYPSVQLTAWKVNDSYLLFLILSLICGTSVATGIAYFTPFAYKLQFWPIVSWVNYQYISLQLRVLFPSFFACCCLEPLLQLSPSKTLYSFRADSLPFLR
ncbi:hypothetical protein Cgig2_020437 [Carnegiea gigantea]|uniref:Peroxisomal membrane protein 2 n=1 Tax=Carnegiea gigantea TaxID=171969 RepID=A0A9Q1JYI4_9CARY|nr:hypothetical protein Cgig2_020437 [Carnegiea gigantea]